MGVIKFGAGVNRPSVRPSALRPKNDPRSDSKMDATAEQVFLVRGGGGGKNDLVFNGCYR